jgi:glycosyltransferase involved in cell wall biosynthesis
MKILFLLTQDLESPSGLGRYWPLAKELACLHHQVTIAALHPDYFHLEKHSFEIEGVKVNYVAPMHVQKMGNIKSYYSATTLTAIVVRAAWQLSRFSLSIPADIVHIGKAHPMNGIAGLTARFILGRQVYLDCDDYETASGHFNSEWQKKGVEFFEKRLPFWVDFITTHTFFNRDRLIAAGIPAERIFYLSNGVDPTRFLPPNPESLMNLRNRLGLNGKKVILFLGSLSRPSHPVDLLFEAFKKIEQTEPLARLLIVGGGDDYNRLTTKVQQMGLGDKVIFTGLIPPEQVVLYYYLANGSVDPVLDDGAARGRSPLKLFESWICGVPFITFDVGDRKRLLGNPPAGLLVSIGDQSALSLALQTILEKPQLAQTLREYGFERVQAYYWKKLAAGLNEIYTNNIKDRNTTAN